MISKEEEKSWFIYQLSRLIIISFLIAFRWTQLPGNVSAATEVAGKIWKDVIVFAARGTHVENWEYYWFDWVMTPDSEQVVAER